MKSRSLILQSQFCHITKCVLVGSKIAIPSLSTDLDITEFDTVKDSPRCFQLLNLRLVHTLKGAGESTDARRHLLGVAKN